MKIDLNRTKHRAWLLLVPAAVAMVSMLVRLVLVLVDPCIDCRFYPITFVSYCVGAFGIVVVSFILLRHDLREDNKRYNRWP